MFFGVVGWIMKRLGWPRPPLVLGIVIGAIFERYLYISTELYGWAWLLRPAVVVILLCVAWALFRPLSQIVTAVVHELRHIRSHHLRFGAAPAFTTAVIALIIAAIISSRAWPAAAQLVPLTACGMALTAAALNLINELFGQEQSAAARGNVDGGVHVAGGFDFGIPGDEIRRRAAMFFLWLAAFIGIVYLIGFIPAICVFVFAYMCFGFGVPWLEAAGFALATGLLCWLVFDWALAVHWPNSLIGDTFPELRARFGLI
jgi:hypothetical protein